MSHPKKGISEAIEAIDESIAELDSEMLDAARNNEDQDVDLIFVALVCTGQPSRIVYTTIDHGDGEGRFFAFEMQRTIISRGFLRENESISVCETRLSAGELLRRASTSKDPS